MKKSFTIAALLTVLLYILGTSISISEPNGAPVGRTNSPFDGASCNDGGCHNATLKTSTTILSSNVPTKGYTPGNTYTFTVSVPGADRKGFQVSPQKNDGTLLGTLTAGTGSHLVGSSKYITHNSAKSGNPATWTFTWKSPAQGTGDVNFYGAFANGRFTETITQVLTIKEDISTSINEIAEKNISVSPNPTQGTINIQLGNISSEKLNINLYNLEGKLVTSLYQGIFTPSMSFNHPIENGVYLLNIITDHHSYTKKLIVNN